ncbi:MAG TPA: hypothetical protein VEB21_20090 [Terriglobales bacterium]|nr:hypothetical protein [Terriglobales bacterium]
MVRGTLLKNAGRVGVCIASLALAGWLVGCGSDGESSITPGQSLPQLEGKLTGVVWAPCMDPEQQPENCGVYAFKQPPKTFWDHFSFVSAAYARLLNTAPVGAEVLVSLSEVDEGDAADGVISAPLPIVNNARTNADGVYSIIHDAIDRIESCRLMVSVGNARNGDLSRAFIYAENTDVDPLSEAVVRVILRRLTLSPPVQLCDFSREGLKFITEVARPAASTAVGNNVEEINDSAYAFVSNDCRVFDAVDAVTGTRAVGWGECEVQN